MLLTARHLVLALGLAAGALAAGEGPYTNGPRSADGIGKYYCGREIAAVMGHQGADWLERPEREREERTDLLLKALELKPGMAVADVGAGSGYFTWRMARLVGPAGRVYAVDIQPEFLDLLAAAMQRRGVAAQVTTVLGATTDPRLPAGACDLILLVDVYHEFDHPHEMTAAMIRALKPDGRLVIVEYRGEDPAVPIKAAHKMTAAQVRKEMAGHAVRFEANLTVLPWQHILVFRKEQ